jgi:hypothetical protein
MEERKFKFGRNEMQALQDLYLAMRQRATLVGSAQILGLEQIQLLVKKGLVTYKENESHTFVFELTQDGVKIAAEVEQIAESIQKWMDETYEKKIRDMENHVFVLKEERRD